MVSVFHHHCCMYWCHCLLWHQVFTSLLWWLRCFNVVQWLENFVNTISRKTNEKNFAQFWSQMYLGSQMCWLALAIKRSKVKVTAGGGIPSLEAHQVPFSFSCLCVISPVTRLLNTIICCFLYSNKQLLVVFQFLSRYRQREKGEIRFFLTALLCKVLHTLSCASVPFTLSFL